MYDNLYNWFIGYLLALNTLQINSQYEYISIIPLKTSGKMMDLKHLTRITIKNIQTIKARHDGYLGIMNIASSRFL